MKETKDYALTLFSGNDSWLENLSFVLQKHQFKTESTNFGARTDFKSLLSSMPRSNMVVTDDPHYAVRLQREKFTTLYAPQSQSLRETRDQIIKSLFPPPELAKRHFTRIPVNIEAFWQMSGLNNEHFLSGKVQNISRRGVFIVPTQLLPKKEEVISLEFTGMTSESLVTFEGLGIVRWTRYETDPPGFGVELVSVSEASADFLKQLCQPLYEPTIKDL